MAGQRLLAEDARCRRQFGLKPLDRRRGHPDHSYRGQHFFYV
ncbi:hypothetical protein OAO87_04075 [bacterium]|nr:hypothetical protein [bacterium]